MLISRKYPSRFILAFDPSGNYDEGKGTTGWCLYDTDTQRIRKVGVIRASNYDSVYTYWQAHLKLIDDMMGYDLTIVIEDFLLYSNRADSQIRSRFETPKLIGVLQFECYMRGLDVVFQLAATVKTRWSDDVLAHKGIIEERTDGYYLFDKNLSDHIKDSIRHAVHYATFRKAGII